MINVKYVNSEFAVSKTYQQQWSKYSVFLLFKGDIIVGKEQIDKGETWWGFWIVMLMFVPNLVFIVWFIIARRNKLSSGGTWLKITIAGSVQLVTLIK